MDLSTAKIHIEEENGFCMFLQKPRPPKAPLFCQKLRGEAALAGGGHLSSEIIYGGFLGATGMGRKTQQRSKGGATCRLASSGGDFDRNIC